MINRRLRALSREGIVIHGRYFMSKKTNIVVGFAIALMTAVAVFVLFANCFSAPVEGSEYGSGFAVMFGDTSKNFGPIPFLIVAFSLECGAFLTAIIGAFLFGKFQAIAYIITSLLLVAAGVIFLLSVSLFVSVNPLNNPEGISLGAAPITSAVFAFIGGALGLFGTYTAIKNN